MSPSERHAKSLRARKYRQVLAQVHQGDGITLDQRQSPLFSRLPPEIRLLIFEFSLAGYRKRRRLLSDPRVAQRYVRCHPAYHFPLQVDINLLLTCRLIYSEANYIPMRSAKFAIVEMIVGSRLEGTHPALPFFARFTSKNSAEMQEVEFCEESAYQTSEYLAVPQFTPKIISFSTRERYVNGDRGEYAQFLRRHFATSGSLHFPSSCKRLNLRFENYKCNEASFRQAIAEISDQRLRTTDKNVELSTEGNEVIFETFNDFAIKPSGIWVDQNVPAAERQYYDELFDTRQSPRLEFVAVTMVFTPRPVQLDDKLGQSTAP